MTQIKINYELEVLLVLIKKESHGRELAKELKTSLTRIQAILQELRKCGVVDYKVEGKNHIYFIKKNLIAKSFLLNAENYKLVKTLNRHHYLMPIFQDIIEKSRCDLIVLFGSYAKSTATENSDIDVYIETNDTKIKEDVRKINDLISIKTGKFNVEDLLIKEIMKNHVIIKGGEIYYEKNKFFG